VSLRLVHQPRHARELRKRDEPYTTANYRRRAACLASPTPGPYRHSSFRCCSSPSSSQRRQIAPLIWSTAQSMPPGPALAPNAGSSAPNMTPAYFVGMPSKRCPLSRRPISHVHYPTPDVERHNFARTAIIPNRALHLTGVGGSTGAPNPQPVPYLPGWLGSTPTWTPPVRWRARVPKISGDLCGPAPLFWFRQD
jgi:hypothetical protein